MINGNTGIWVNPLDAGQVAAAMLSIDCRSQWAAELGENAAGHVMQNFTVRQYADRFEALMRTMVGE